MSDRSAIKAVGLFSGGLDSMLAVCLMREQGIEVTALHMRTGFSYEERSRIAGRVAASNPLEAERFAAQLGVPLEVIDISEAYLPMVLHPRFGYGSGLNPCVDCRILLLRTAKAWMEAHGYHFVFTGEVVGQRPKSQMRPTLNTVERESGLQGYLLRPLSARLLKPTIPELRGWVDRERLGAIAGRGRREQMALAQRFGLREYAQPFGGCCYLIDQAYARRLRDFLAREGGAALNREHVQLLAVGRHLRLPSGHKVIVGRNERENEALASAAVEGLRLTTVDHPGPTALLLGTAGPAEIELAAQITAGYSDGAAAPSVRVAIQASPGLAEGGCMIEVAPLARERIRAMMV